MKTLNIYLLKKSLVFSLIFGILGAYLFILNKDKTIANVFLFISVVQFILYIIVFYLKKNK